MQRGAGWDSGGVSGVRAAALDAMRGAVVKSRPRSRGAGVLVSRGRVGEVSPGAVAPDGTGGEGTGELRREWMSVGSVTVGAGCGPIGRAMVVGRGRMNYELAHEECGAAICTRAG
jgi:hypothetical protein